MFHWLIRFLVGYGISLLLLYTTDVGENKRYRDRVGLRRLLLHGLVILPITILVGIYVPECPIC